MKINSYSITQDTAAVLTCIEEASTLWGHIYEAIAMHYDEAQIGTGEAEDKEKIGNNIFEALQTIQNELFEIMQGEIVENLCTTSEKKEI